MTEPFLVKDINPGSGSSSPGNLTVVGDTLYFNANDGTTGNELWKSDGTKAGTVLVKDTNPISDGSPRYLTAVGDTLYFSANDGVTGLELWKSDGSEEGTVLVKDIIPGSGWSGPGYLTAVGDTLYFLDRVIADDGRRGHELWKSNGTEEGTVLVKDIIGASSYSYLYYLTAAGDTLYFTADDGSTGRELWKSDGTEAGTALVKDIRPGSSYSAPFGLTAIRDTLYFSAINGVTGNEVWKSDGTEEGTVLVKDINPGSGWSNPRYLTAIGDTFYFTADDSVTGYELWKSDGTEAGTVLVKDINPGIGSSDPFSLTAVGDTLYFTANDGVTGNELWKSDGSEEGTVLVKEIIPGIIQSGPRYLTSVGDTLLFTADDSVTGYELWKSDGTEAGTVLVKDIRPGSSGSAPSELTAIGDTLYFSATDGDSGLELWSYTPSSPPPPPSTPFDPNDLVIGIYNTQTDQLVTPLEDGDALTTDDLSGLVTLAVSLPSGREPAEKVGSMRLTLTSEAGGQVSRVENFEPYAIFGNKKGDFFGGLPFGPGDYSLEVEVFSESAGGGIELGSTNYNFSVLPGLSEQISVGFYNTTFDQQVASLQDGDVVSTRDLVGPITLGVTLPIDSDWMGSVGSMELRLTDATGSEVSRVENFEPYALFGNRDADFFNGIEFVSGEYSLQLTAFSKKSGNGIAFGSSNYSFNVEEGSASDLVDFSTVIFSSEADSLPTADLLSSEITVLVPPRSSQPTSVPSDNKVVVNGDLSTASAYQDGNQSTPPPPSDDQLASSTSTQLDIDPITGLDRQGSFYPSSPTADHIASSPSSPTDPITGVSSGSNTPTTFPVPSTWPISTISAIPGTLETTKLAEITSETILSTAKPASDPTIPRPSSLVASDLHGPGLPLVI